MKSNNVLIDFYKNERIPIIIFFMPIFVEILNGLIHHFTNINFSISVIYRISIILLTFPYIFLIKNQLLKSFIVSILLLFQFELIVWNLTLLPNNIKLELYNFTRIIYPYLLLSYLIYKKISIKSVLNISRTTVFIASSSILFSFVTGIGVSTFESHSEDQSFGVKGFFISQNDTGLFICLSLIYSYYFLFKEKNKFNIFNIITIFISLILLATRTGLIGSFLSTVIIVSSLLFFDSKDINISKFKKYIIVFSTFIFTSVSSYFVYQIISEYSFLINKFESTLEETPRSAFEKVAKKRFQERPIINNIFGEGNKSFYTNIGRKVFASGHVGVEKNVEVDTYDFFGAYGFTLGFLLLFFPIFIFFKNLKIFIFERKFINFIFLLSISFFLAHSFLAGHALNSPMVSLAILPTYLYSLTYYKRKEHEL